VTARTRTSALGLPWATSLHVGDGLADGVIERLDLVAPSIEVEQSAMKDEV
jgi:hypothetical protein